MYLVFTRMPGESYRGDVPLVVEFMYLVFTRMPGESYRGDVPLVVEFMYLVFTRMRQKISHWFVFFCDRAAQTCIHGNPFMQTGSDTRLIQHTLTQREQCQSKLPALVYDILPPVGKRCSKCGISSVLTGLVYGFPHSLYHFERMWCTKSTMA